MSHFFKKYKVKFPFQNYPSNNDYQQLTANTDSHKVHVVCYWTISVFVLYSCDLLIYTLFSTELTAHVKPYGAFFCGPSFKADSAVSVLKRLVNRVCLVSPRWNAKIDLLSKFLKLTLENMKSVIGFTLVVLLAISCNGQFVSLNPCERAIWR